MSVKQTQFSYDSTWFERKKEIGSQATWKTIMEVGIIAMEKLKTKNIDYKIDFDVSGKSDVIESKKENGVFEINLSPNTFIDKIESNKWVQIKSEELKTDDVIRFRNKVDGFVESINGKKRFKFVNIKFSEENNISFTLKIIEDK